MTNSPEERRLVPVRQRLWPAWPEDLDRFFEQAMRASPSGPGGASGAP